MIERARCLAAARFHDASLQCFYVLAQSCPCADVSLLLNHQGCPNDSIAAHHKQNDCAMQSSTAKAALGSEFDPAIILGQVASLQESMGAP